MTIRVLIVDDSGASRLGFRMMLAGHSGIEVVGEASDGESAIEACRRLCPDVVLMDVRMPRLDGIRATAAILAQSGTAGPRPRVLILTTFDLDDYAFDGLQAGASGFLLKDLRPEQLLSAVRAVHEGDAVVTPRITRRLLERAAWRSEQPSLATAPPAPDPQLASLTPREGEIAAAIAEGLTNAEIAERFFLAAGTVKTYVSRILSKLDARDRVEIVLRVHRAREM